MESDSDITDSDGAAGEQLGVGLMHLEIPPFLELLREVPGNA